jgi:hypothetical protein
LTLGSVIVYAPTDTDEVVHPARYATARIVIDPGTANGREYTVPTVPLGVEPSVVYRIAAPGVVVDSVTLCADVYVPGDGEKVGGATVPVIVYTPTDTDDVVHPALYATALIVMDEGTESGPEYVVPAVSLGVEPSVVYRIVAPDVVVEIVTLCADVYVPGDGLNIGVATVSPPPEPDPPPQAMSKTDRSRKESILGRDFILNPPLFMFSGIPSNSQRCFNHRKIHPCKIALAISKLRHEKKVFVNWKFKPTSKEP